MKIPLFAFHPKATKLLFRQVFWLVLSWPPSHPMYSGTVAKVYRDFLPDLQLRVQLPFFTGFPL